MPDGERVTAVRVVRRQASAFTLLELLVVILILALLGGLMVGLPTGDRRLAAVRSSAEELAATLRTARALAMDQAIVCGVAFNIQNAPDTSGVVLNNWSGGHWYRIIGAQQGGGGQTRVNTYPLPSSSFAAKEDNGAGDVSEILTDIEGSWYGEPHVLPPHSVRFLALSDQDSGSGGWATVAAGGKLPGIAGSAAAYPRPWYGYWNGGILYPWGGYDGSKPAAERVTDAAGRYCSGFYFEGGDGTITGCRNPADRFTTHVGTQGDVPRKQIFKQGQPRALVNAAWLDVVIAFNPDGTIAMPLPPLAMRAHSWALRGPVNGHYSGGGGLNNGDLGPYASQQGDSNKDLSPLQCFVRGSGSWSITLAPDAERDSDAFPTARSALDSMWPMCRVTVNALGDVQVVQVGANVPAGISYNTAITDWQATAQIKTNYQNLTLTNPDGTPATYVDATGATRLWQPVDRFLSPSILGDKYQRWWRQP